MPKKRNPYYKTSAITPIMRGGGDIWNRTNPWRNKGARTDNEMQGEKGSFMDKMTEGFGEVVGSALDSYGTGDKARAYFGNMYGEDTTSGNSKISNAVGGFQQGFVKAGASSIGMGDMYQTKIDAGKHNAGAATYSNQGEISGNSALVGNVAGSAVMAYATKGKGKKSANTSPTENTSPTFDNSQSFSTSPSMTGMDSTLGYARLGGEVPKMGEGGNPYSTVLTPEDSVKYNQWKNTIPKRLQYEGDYDLAGFWKKNPTWTPNTPGVHMTDQFKKPNHPTFSNESQYYNDSLKYKAGYWENDNYIPFKKADGGNVGNPNYEAENKEFVIGGNPNNYGGGRLKRYGTGLTKIEGATHEQGGVGMRGGDFVISAKQSFRVPESFLNDIKHLL